MPLGALGDAWKPKNHRVGFVSFLRNSRVCGNWWQLYFKVCIFKNIFFLLQKLEKIQIEDIRWNFSRSSSNPWSISNPF